MVLASLNSLFPAFVGSNDRTYVDTCTHRLGAQCRRSSCSLSTSESFIPSSWYASRPRSSARSPSLTFASNFGSWYHSYASSAAQRRRPRTKPHKQHLLLLCHALHAADNRASPPSSPLRPGHGLTNAPQGMYPTAVIVLVALQKSQLDHHFTYPSCPTSHSHSGVEGASLPFSARTGTLGATYASSSSTEPPSLAHAGRTRAHGQEPGVKARARAEAQVIALLDVKRAMTNTTNVTGAGDSVWETTEDKDGECEEGFGLAK